MNVISIFRFLLVLSWFFAILELGSIFMLEDTLPPDLKNYLMQVHRQEISTKEGFLSIVGMAVILISMPAASIALWRFQHWGRVLYIFNIVVFIVMYPMLGPYVSTGIESMFGMIGELLQGSLLVIMFSNEINHKFRCKGFVVA